MPKTKKFEPGRAEFEARYGQVWNTREVEHDFLILGFSAPLVFAERKKDHKRGVLLFNDSPRFYFDFQPVKG